MPAPKVKRGQNGSKSFQSVLAGMYADLVGQIVADDRLTTYTVATLPTPAQNAGQLAFCSNGAAGQPAVVYCNGTAWKVVGVVGATAATS